jgi:photosystem II stability/assembly factor-like uncharacterized protein
LRSRAVIFLISAQLALAAAGAALVWRTPVAPGPEPAAGPPAVTRALMAADGDDWFQLQRAYPSSRNAPADALEKAMNAWRGAADRSPRPKLAITGDRWTSMGPQPIAVPNGLTYAGRITTIATHSTNANILYAGSNDGGIWKSTDLGGSWSALNETLAFPAIASIAIDPVDPNLIYAVTAARTYQSRMLRSTDAGATWSESAITAGGRTLIIAGKIVVDPSRAGSSTASTVYVIGFSNVLRSDDSGRTFRSVLQLANDQDFATLTSERAPNAPTIRDIALDPSQGSKLFVVVAEPNCVTSACANATATMALYRSTNAGGNWARGVIATAGQYIVPNRRHTELFGPYTPRARVAIARTNASVVALAFLDDGVARPRVYRSTDGGDNFSEVAPPQDPAEFVWPLALAISPTNANEMYVANNAVARTTDGGATWTRLGAPHGDQTTLVFNAGGTLIVGNDGGMFRFNASNSTFTAINNTLSITELYMVAAHPTNPLLLTAGAQDNGGIQFRGALGWSAYHGGDGGDTVFDPAPNSTTVYSEIEWFFQPTDGSQVFEFFRCTISGTCAIKNAGFNLNDAGPFIPKFAIDKTRPDSVWLTVERLYRTDNRADTWAAASPSVKDTQRCWSGTPGAPGSACATGGYFTTVALAPSNTDVVYAGALNGDIWVSTNRGGAWRSSAGTTVAPLPVRPVTQIQVDPVDPQIAYATYSGFNAAGQGNGHVFKTSDGGQSWTDISGALPDIPANTVLIDPDSAVPGSTRVIYVGTDIGIYKLADSTPASWQTFGNGMPFVPVTDIIYNPTTKQLVAATYGRGIWTISSRFSR